MIQGSLQNENISVAESTRHSWEEEDNRLAREYDIKVRQMELDVLKIENRWSALLKAPLTIIKLPMYVIMAVGYCIAMARNHDVSKEFWNLFK